MNLCKLECEDEDCIKITQQRALGCPKRRRIQFLVERLLVFQEGLSMQALCSFRLLAVLGSLWENVEQGTVLLPVNTAMASMYGMFTFRNLSCLLLYMNSVVSPWRAVILCSIYISHLRFQIFDGSPACQQVSKITPGRKTYGVAAVVIWVRNQSVVVKT